MMRKGGATINFHPSTNPIKPIDDYVILLDEISQYPPLSSNAPLFNSRVGIAKVALLAGSLEVFQLWSVYVLVMCIYHWSEFLITCYFHPHTANFDSFLVNQSIEFGIAISLGWIEFWLESYFFPSFKASFRLVSIIGLIIVIIGQIIRSLAMIQAGPSFTHLIAVDKEHRHVLVKNGLYSVLRHPGYFGWFYWSIGTQILLMNPFCVIAYFYAAWRFFKARIPVEEQYLIDIFGDEYRDYIEETWIGIPGI